MLQQLRKQAKHVTYCLAQKQRVLKQQMKYLFPEKGKSCFQTVSESANFNLTEKTNFSVKYLVSTALFETIAT